LPPGFLGTRADLIVDVVLVLNCVAPFWAVWAARQARAGQVDVHAKAQVALCVLAVGGLFVLEGNIRLSGGSGSLIAPSPYAGTALLKGVFIAHIFPAVFTYIVWVWLAVVSRRRRDEQLPGAFSRRHRRWGWVIIVGLAWTALSALAVYTLGFVATA